MEGENLCRVCQLRKGVYFNRQACKKCSELTAAEGTREKFGLPKPRATKATRDATLVRRFNYYRAQGLTLKQIAEKLKMPLQSLKNRKRELAQAGYPIDLAPTTHTNAMAPQPPKQRQAQTAGRVLLDHGGGKWGIHGCNCELCLAVRRKSRNKWWKDNPDKRRQYQQRGYRKKPTN